MNLTENRGIPGRLLLMMAIVSGLTVANLYYSQPLLEEMRLDFGASDAQANLITVITQTGYACGLLFIVPMADMWSRRKIVITSMLIAMVMAGTIACAPSLPVVLAVSFFLGMSSVIPQIFIPVAGLYSEPRNKARNMGYVSSGLLTGILAARIVSGYVGDWAGWRTMYWIASALMAVCMIITLKVLPEMKNTFSGTYSALMKSVWKIFRTRPMMRMYSLRVAFSFGSMMSVWSCMAFHLSGSPFYADSEKIGMLGLCGVVGAVAASGIGKFVPRYGVIRMSAAGALLQFLAWCQVFFFGDTYWSIVAAIIMLEIGAQCQQLSNQSACLQAIPAATNRANTIFMTSLFIGGSIGTLVSGYGWKLMGWGGVCITGAVFSICSLAITFYESRTKRQETCHLIT